MVPTVNEDESFESYLARWPQSLSHVPEVVVQTLAFRHNEQVVQNPDVYDFENWVCRIELFSNERIFSVGNFESVQSNDIGIADLMLRRRRERTWLFEFLLSEGTFPEPIIVIENGGRHPHIVPRISADELLVSPYHVFEGHKRLSYLKLLIEKDHENVKDSHPVIIFKTEL